MKTPSSRVLISDHHCFKHPSGNVFIPLSASVEKVVPPLGFPPSKPMVADPPVTPLGFGQVSNFFCARWPLDPALCNAMCIHSINHLCLGGPLYFASLNLPHLLVCLFSNFALYSLNPCVTGSITCVGPFAPWFKGNFSLAFLGTP